MPEYYSLAENNFYYTMWPPVFKIKDGKLIFIGYPDYIDMEMLPNSH